MQKALEAWPGAPLGTEGNLVGNPEKEWSCRLEMQSAPTLGTTLPSSRALSLGKRTACLISSCCYNPGGSLGPPRLVKSEEGPRAASLPLRRQVPVLLQAHTPAMSHLRKYLLPSHSASPSPLLAHSPEMLSCVLGPLGAPNEKCLQKPHFHFIHITSWSLREPEMHTK